MEPEKNSEEINRSFSLEGNEFIIEKRFLSIGNQYYIRDDNRKKIGFCEEKSLRIKGELRVYESDKKDNELFRIKQENIMDFSGLFKVVDKENEEVVGYLKRRLPESVMLSDWSIMDTEKEAIGRAVEDSVLKELVRFKGLGKLPYRYKLSQNGRKVGFCKQRLTVLKNVYRLQIEDQLDPNIDRRLLLSLALLLDAVEGKYRKMKKVLSGG